MTAFATAAATVSVSSAIIAAVMGSSVATATVIPSTRRSMYRQRLGAPGFRPASR